MATHLRDVVPGHLGKLGPDVTHPHTNLSGSPGAFAVLPPRLSRLTPHASRLSRLSNLSRSHAFTPHGYDIRVWEVSVNSCKGDGSTRLLFDYLGMQSGGANTMESLVVTPIV